MSASEHASKASRVEQADELILQANKQMSQWMSEWPRTYVRIHGSSELIYRGDRIITRAGGEIYSPALKFCNRISTA